MDGFETPAGSGLGRRAAWSAIALVTVSVLLEAMLLDPQDTAGASPLAALRLGGMHALPYLAAAASAGALAWLPLPARPARGRLLVLAALLLGLVASLRTPAFLGALAGNALQVSDGCARTGAGPGCLPLDPVPIEEAGTLATIGLPARPAAEQVELRWVVTRDLEPPPAGARVELVGGGTARDVTATLLATPPGGASVLSRSLRVGPVATTARLRVAGDPLPPAPFFDATRLAATEGLAVDAGDGDRAWREPTGAQDVPALRVRGDHGAGHAVIVLSGEAWGAHDLRALRDAGGVLELTLVGDDGWSVQLTGNGGASSAVPLAGSRRTGIDGATRHTLRLTDFELGPVAPSGVVGVALVRTTPGTFLLDVRTVRATATDTRRSGFGLATLGALQPTSTPGQALAAVAAPAARTFPVSLLRFVAAILALLGGLGLPSVIAVLREPRGLLALAVGPALLVATDRVLPLALDRVEAGPLVLATVAIGSSVAALLPVSRPPVEAPGRLAAPHVSGDPGASPRPSPAHAEGSESHTSPMAFARSSAALAIGALGVVAVHASADPSGGPWADAPAASRVVPALVHAVGTAFDAPFFALALLAGTAASGGPPLRSATRWIPAALVWSAAWPLLGLGKAAAFGYAGTWQARLVDPGAWLRALLLGDAQYHLALFPTLLVLLALAPAFAPASRRPVLALLLPLPLLTSAWLTSELGALIADPGLRPWAALGARALGWSGYAWLAWALGSLGPSFSPLRRTALVVAGLGGAAALAVLLNDAATVAETGRWTGGIAVNSARGLLPAAVFTVFAAVDIPWPAWLQRLGALGLGVYLVHPLFLDACEVLLREVALSPPVRVGIDIGLVYAGSLVFVAVAARIPGLRTLVVAGVR
jgi:hypothetical protein